jgi:DNA modification methylase
MTLDAIIDAIGIEPYYREPAGVIYCADCLDILPLIPDKAIDLCLTDPPYGINANKMQLGTGQHIFDRGNNWDARPITELHFNQIFRVSENVCIWGGNYYANILPTNNKWLIWHKLNDGLSFSEAELAWTNYSPNTRVFSKYVANRIKYHPTEKPIEVIELGLSFSPMAELILEPFLGSGTTAVAAKQLGRKFIGIELSETYVKLAIQRLQQEVMEV